LRLGGVVVKSETPVRHRVDGKHSRNTISGKDLVKDVVVRGERICSLYKMLARTGGEMEIESCFAINSQA